MREKLLMLALMFLCCMMTKQTTEQASRKAEQRDIVDDLIKKLFRICESPQSISLFDCLPNLMANDKKMGNFKQGFNYTRETIYMMAVYDKNEDGRLNYNELYKMGGDIMEGQAEDYRIDQKLEELEKNGWIEKNRHLIHPQANDQGKGKDEKVDNSLPADQFEQL